MPALSELRSRRDALSAQRSSGVPDIAALRALFAPPPESLPGVKVQLAELSSYDRLVGTMTIGEEAAA